MTPAFLHLISSRQARFGLAVLHVAAVLVALVLPLPWCVAVLLGVLAHWLRRPVQQPVYLQALPDGQVEVTWQDGARWQMTFLPSSVITPWLIVLQLSGENGRVYLTLWPDSAKRDVLRQWRVWLRWHLPAIKRRQIQPDSNE